MLISHRELIKGATLKCVPPLKVSAFSESGALIYATSFWSRSVAGFPLPDIAIVLVLLIFSLSHNAVYYNNGAISANS